LIFNDDDIGDRYRTWIYTRQANAMRQQPSRIRAYFRDVAPRSKIVRASCNRERSKKHEERNSGFRHPHTANTLRRFIL
jgi:hypothetical protein